MRPARYHKLSPISTAKIDSTSTGSSCAPIDPGCSAAIAPNRTSVGIAGTGSPSDDASTLANTSQGPYCSTRSCSIGLLPRPFWPELKVTKRLWTHFPDVQARPNVTCSRTGPDQETTGEKQVKRGVRN